MTNDGIALWQAITNGAMTLALFFLIDIYRSHKALEKHVGEQDNKVTQLSTDVEWLKRLNPEE